jgi:hypothetical protein
MLHLSLHPSLLSPTAKFSSSLDPMPKKEIIPYGVDLNKLPSKENSLAIIPVEEPLHITVIPC